MENLATSQEPAQVLPGQLPTQDPAPQAEPAQAPDQFAAVTRKEMDLWQKTQELNQREKELNDRMGKYDNIQDPRGALDAFGYSYEDIVNHELGQEEPKQLTQEEMKAQIMSEIRADQEKTRAEKEREASTSRAEQEHLSQIKTHLDSKVESYEALLAFGNEKDVYGVIEEVYKKSGKILPIEQAAVMAEKNALTQLQDLLKSEKVRSLLQRELGAPQHQGERTLSRENPELNQSAQLRMPDTLTNNTFNQGRPAQASSRPLTDQERMANAISKLN